MAAMASLFKETRVGLDWVRPNVTFDIDIPTHFVKDHSDDLPDTAETYQQLDDESKFSYRNLATSSSVHFRSINRFPRSILWRVIEGGTVLVLTPVDVSKHQDANMETGTGFRLHFPETIRPSCVALYDPSERDVVLVYVLTTANVLYTLSLRPEFFSTADESVRLHDGWCQSYAPSTLVIRAPHFIQPIASGTLVIALQDGGLVRLSRIIQEAGVKKHHAYLEQAFSDGSYLKSITSLVGWRAAQIPYGDTQVSSTTTISLAFTYRYSLMFTVSINHQLKVWSMEKGTILSAHDLLGIPNTNAPTIRNFLDPKPSTLISLIDISLGPLDMFYLLTLSPSAGGIFKLWVATHDNTPSFTRLYDMYPNQSFEVQPPSINALWVITDFGLSPLSPNEPSKFSLWVLWKSNTSSRLQNTIIDIKNMETGFGDWMNATPEEKSTEKLRLPVDATNDETKAAWLGWIFQAGRFTDAVVETALSIYEKNYTSRRDASSGTKRGSSQCSLQDKVCLAVEAALIAKNESQKDAMEEEVYQRDLENQWSQFNRLCLELDKQRSEALSLSVDLASGLAFVPMTDSLTILRKGTDLEMLCTNIKSGKEVNGRAIEVLQRNSLGRMKEVLTGALCEDVTLLLRAAAHLKGSLQNEVFDDCQIMLEDEAFKNATTDVATRIDAIYERCFNLYMEHALYQEIINMITGIQDIEAAFQSLISCLTEWERHPGQSKLTVFGEKLVLRGSQELIYVNITLLFDLAFLIVFIYSSEDVEIKNVDELDRIFLKILQLFRESSVLGWLSEHSWPTSIANDKEEQFLRQELGSLRNSDAKSMPQIHNTSVLQIILDENSGPPPSMIGTGAVTLTSCIRRFLSGVEMGNYDTAVTHIASRLLRMDVKALATDFAYYLPTTYWGWYMKARVALNSGDRQQASEMFRRVALGIASPRHTPISSMETLFSPLEVSMLCAGLPKYYFHVAELFEQSKYYEEVVKFTGLASSALTDNVKEDDLALQSDVLSRQFSAALQVNMFDEAYLALTQYTDKVLQKQALRSLVGSMCENYAAEQLCTYPFIGLHEEVDEALDYKCQLVEDVSTSPSFHKILYSWRIQRGDFRGAGTILYAYLQLLRSPDSNLSNFPNSEVSDVYLTLLNCLSSVTKEQAWVFTYFPELAQGAGGEEVTKMKRKVVTVDNIREEYLKELERMNVYLSGGYFF